jgi:hypothetical protein
MLQGCYSGTGRCEALAGLFLAAYIGLVVPVLGLATQLLSTQVAVPGFAAALLLMVAAVSVRLLRRRRVGDFGPGMVVR